jgi:hypothetical protein
MLKCFDLKLYRKFLILAVLLGSLFVTFSFNRAAAAYPCCGPLHAACDATYNSCVDFCDFQWPPNSSRHAKCVGFCEDDWFQCYADAEICDHGC